jgi:hypothetical protein
VFLRELVRQHCETISPFSSRCICWVLVVCVSEAARRQACTLFSPCMTSASMSPLAIVRSEQSMLG